MTLSFETSHRATKGARRYQEDACEFVRLQPTEIVQSRPGASTVPVAVSGAGVIAVLADGMGGHVGGERASTVACRGFLDALAAIDGAASDNLDIALEQANAAIRREVEATPGLSGMGCTFIGAVVDGIGLRWISVGDSRLFLFRKGELYLLNEDHSLAPLLDALAQRGEMSEEQALNHPRRHHLRSALTGEAIELIDLARDRVRLQPDDCVLLASDGLDTLEPNEIADLIETHRSEGATAIATALIETIETLSLPGQDNTTVMAVMVKG